METTQRSEADVIREAMRLLRKRNTPAQQAAARRNGKRGGRPPGHRKPLALIECNCGAGDSPTGHKSTCARGRAIKRRLATGEPLE